MTGLRAIARRGLSECPRSQQLPSDHEIDWLAVRVSNDTDRSRLWRGLEMTPNDPTRSRWRNLSWRKVQVRVPRKETDGFWGQGYYTWSVITGPRSKRYESLSLNTSGLPTIGRRSAQEVFQARIRLGYLTRWPGGYSDEATTLAAAIEVMMNNNTLRAFDPEENQFLWYMTASFHGVPEDIKFKVRRNEDGEWKAELSEIEAVLSLWMFSVFEKENATPEEKSRPHERDAGGDWLRSGKASTRKGIRLLGSSTPCLRRDLKWWAGDGAKAVAEIDLSQESDDISESKIKISDDHKIVGFGGEELRSGIYKRKLLAEIPIIEIPLANEVTPPTDALNRSSLGLNYKNTNRLPSIHANMPISPLNPVVTKENVKNPEDSWCCLATISEAPVAMLFSQEMFSAFLWAFTHCTKTKQVTGKTSVVESTLDPKERWQSVTLRNDNLTSLVEDIERTGLGNANDIYMSIIPPFSARGKLPDTSVVVEYINDQAKRYQLEGNWELAANMYLWTFKACNHRSFGPRHIDQHPMHDLTSSVPDCSMANTNIQDSDTAVSKSGSAPAHTIDNPISLVTKAGVASSNEILTRLESTTQVRATATFLVFLHSWRAEIVRFREKYLEKADDPSPALATQLAKYVKVLRDFGDVRIMHHLERLCRRQGLDPAWLNTNQGQFLSTNGLSFDPSGSQSDVFDISETFHLTQQHQAIFEYLSESVAHHHTNVKDVIGWTPLHYAASIGYEEWIEKLLKDGADWRSDDMTGRTPLHCAAENQRIHLKWTHIRSRVNINAQAYDGLTPLHCAARSGNEGMAQLLIQSGADLQVYDRSRKTALHWAASTGSVFIVRQLLRSGANREASDEFGRTPLQLAVMQGRTGVVTCTIGDAAEKDVVSLIHLAVIHERVEVLQELFECGTCLDRCTNTDRALHIVAESRNGGNAITFLAKKECDRLASAASSNHTILHMTVNESTRNIAKILLNNQMDACKAKGTKPALHTAIEKGEVGPRNTMLFYGANPDADWGDESALLIAAHRGSVEIVKALLQFGANPDTTDGSQCVLHIAVKQNSIEMVKLLLEHGADANGSGSSYTPLDVATEEGRTDIIDLLLLSGASPGGASRHHYTIRMGRPRISPSLVFRDDNPDEEEVANKANRTQDPTSLPSDTKSSPNKLSPISTSSDRNTRYPITTTLRPPAQNSNYEPYIFPTWRRGAAYALRGLIEHEHVNPTKVKLLLDVGTDPDAAGGMLLLAAIDKGNEELARLLLDRGASPDGAHAQDPNARWSTTPISAAISKGHLSLVEMLVQKGVDSGHSRYLDTAIKSQHVEVVKCLLRYYGGFNLVKREIRLRLLNSAIDAGNIAIAKLLLDKIKGLAIRMGKKERTNQWKALKDLCSAR